MSTKPKKYCFTLMPFTEEFDDIYQLGIKQSCEDANAYCERVDEQIFTESILERIYNQISKADIIIADMTNRNPNVFYEVGYAHALGKRTILLTQNSEDIPFDLKHYPHIIYNRKISVLKKELTSRIKWFVENESAEALTQNVEIDVYLNDQSLSSRNVTYLVPVGKIPHPTLTLHNTTFRTFKPADYRIGVITEENYVRLTRNEERSKTIRMPDGRNLHMCPGINDILYPNSYTTLNFLLVPNRIIREDGIRREVEYSYRVQQEVTIRVFTLTGTRDFFLMIKPQEQE
jgi:hypothetical protein